MQCIVIWHYVFFLYFTGEQCNTFVISMPSVAMIYSHDICRFVGGNIITLTAVGLWQYLQPPEEWIHVRNSDVIGYRWYNNGNPIPYTPVDCSSDQVEIGIGSIPEDGINSETIIQLNTGPSECREYSLQAYIQRGGRFTNTCRLDI